MPHFGGFTDLSQNVGATSVELVKADGGRRYLFIQNTHASAVLWVQFSTSDATASTAGNVRVGPGQALEYGNGGAGFVPTTEINVISDTAATPVTAFVG